MATPDKRRFKRRKIQVQVAVFYRGDYFYEKSCEVSEGGMLLRVTSDYAVGDLVELCFVASSGDLVEERAEVVYRLVGEGGESYVGVRFIDISINNQKLIHQFVES